MKTVFNNEVYHVWASETQHSGRNSGHNMSFIGDSAYSYRAEIGRRVKRAGKTWYLLTTRAYSPTTTGHQTTLRAAVRGNGEVLLLPSLDMATVVDMYKDEQLNLLKKLATANKRNAVTYAGKILAAHKLHNERVTQWNLATGEKVKLEPTPSVDNAAQALEKYLAKEKKAEAAAQRAQLRAQSKYLAVTQAKLAEWCAGVLTSPLSTFQNLPCSLRIRTYEGVDKTTIETSHGASVPGADALRLWPILQRARAKGVATTGLDIQIGRYTLSAISKDGDITVGCHQISYRAMDAIHPELKAVLTNKNLGD